jgi:hypothetical protein
MPILTKREIYLGATRKCRKSQENKRQPIQRNCGKQNDRAATSPVDEKQGIAFQLPEHIPTGTYVEEAIMDKTERAERKAALLADDQQFPHLPVPGLWRRARKSHTCIECGGSINPSERYFEYTGSVPAYQTGDAYHRGCAITVWLDFEP